MFRWRSLVTSDPRERLITQRKLDRRGFGCLRFRITRAGDCNQPSLLQHFYPTTSESDDPTGLDTPAPGVVCRYENTNVMGCTPVSEFFCADGSSLSQETLAFATSVVFTAPSLFGGM